VNLEYFVCVVEDRDGVVFFDMFVGIDLYMMMVNGLGVFGWGVGGIEVEVVMLG